MPTKDGLHGTGHLGGVRALDEIEPNADRRPGDRLDLGAHDAVERNDLGFEVGHVALRRRRRQSSTATTSSGRTGPSPKAVCRRQSQ